MEEIKISEELYLFRSGGGNIPITFNQYLLLGDEPMLIHTGSRNQAVELIPKLRRLLGALSLSYIFVSHFEGDECGGLSLLLEYFPDAKPICSEITARQLVGFGVTDKVIIKSPSDKLDTRDYDLSFISYPSEMHLWEGLLAYENKRNILFSSDLFIHFESINDITLDSNLKDEVAKITTSQIPSQVSLEILKQTLTNLPVKEIMPGHGPVIRL